MASLATAVRGHWLTGGGVLGPSAVGFGGLLDGHSATLMAFRVTAPAALLMAAAGWALVERAGRVRG
ncbi:hypothetical protein [Streptomyces sp. NPDC001070]